MAIKPLTSLTLSRHYLCIEVDHLINTNGRVEHIDELRSVDGTGRKNPLELEDAGDFDRGFPLPCRLHGPGVHFVGIVRRVVENGSLQVHA